MNTKDLLSMKESLVAKLEEVEAAIRRNEDVRHQIIGRISQVDDIMKIVKTQTGGSDAD